MFAQRMQILPASNVTIQQQQQHQLKERTKFYVLTSGSSMQCISTYICVRFQMKLVIVCMSDSLSIQIMLHYFNINLEMCSHRSGYYAEAP